MPLSPPPGAHLVLEAGLEVAEEGGRLEALDLPVLHGPAVQVVVQLHGEDGGRPALVLAAFIACGTSEQHEPAPGQRPQPPTAEASGAPSSAQAWLEKLGKALPLGSLSESICIMGVVGADSKVSESPPSTHSPEVRPESTSKPSHREGPGLTGSHGRAAAGLQAPDSEGQTRIWLERVGPGFLSHPQF